MNKILFISPQFFNLEKHIIRGFEELDYEVTFFDERVSSDSLSKILLRKFPRLVKKRLNKYYTEIYEAIQDNDFSILFVVKSENMPEWFLQKVKDNFPNLKLVHYMYDPIKNYPQILEKTKLFNVCFSFDSEDCKKYGWNHRALFFPTTMDHNDISTCSVSKDTRQYTGSFIGTLHTDRARVIEDIKQNLPNEISKKLYIYYYIPLKLMFWVGKYLRRDYKYLNGGDVSTIPLSSNDTKNIMNNSDFIIDVHHDNQSGLTTRTMEALGMNRKLLTTNPFIKEYDFYTENNILIVDKYKMNIDPTWFDKEYQVNDNYNRDDYTVVGFVREILTKTQEEK